MNLFDLFVRLEVYTAHTFILRSTKFNHLICFKSCLSDLELAFSPFLFLLGLNDDVLLGLSEFVGFSCFLQVKLAQLFLINLVKFVSHLLTTDCRFVQVKLVCLSLDVLRLGNYLRLVIIIGDTSWSTHSLCCFRCCIFLRPLLRQLDRSSQNFMRLHQCLVAISVLRLRCVECVLFPECTVIVVIVVIIVSLLIRFEICQAISMFFERVATCVRLQSLYIPSYVRSGLGLGRQTFQVSEWGGIVVVSATVSEVSVNRNCFYLWLVVKVKHIEGLHPLLQLSLSCGYRGHE